MTVWRLGTVGFGYQQWVGNFYAPALKSADFLAFYSQYFNSAEIDSTFYGTPKPRIVERWGQTVPPDFTFCPKTPRQITHESYLPHAIELMRTFVHRMQLLGDKLGPILIQFPPSFTIAQLDTLTPFLAALPEDARFAVEFRDTSWRRGRVLKMLSRFRMAWVSADYIHLPPEIHATTDFLYLRFIGKHGQFATKDRELLDQTERLTDWLSKIDPHLATLRTVYGFFNNDYSGHSPATANRFKQLVGLEPRYPNHPTQPALF
jgi:uncharacterized protein YecE (DUF72 family)